MVVRLGVPIFKVFTGSFKTVKDIFTKFDTNIKHFQRMHI